MKINYEQQCHNLITALFKLQDRYKEHPEPELIQPIEGDDFYSLLRTKSTIKFITKTGVKSSHYVRVKDICDVPMVLMEYLLYLQDLERYLDREAKGEKE